MRPPYAQEWRSTTRSATTTSSRRSSRLKWASRSWTSTSRGPTISSRAGLTVHNSIYGFRGADIRNILEFTDDYPDAHIVKLEQNYRSTQTILDAANAVISHNRGQMVKHLWTDVGEGDKVRVREMADEHAEARWVTAEIERLVDQGASRNEIAVFYRTNAQSRVLEDMLVRANVAYQVVGGPKFYERAEIKDAIQYLTFLVNPQDATAFVRDRQLAPAGAGADVAGARARVRGCRGDLGLGGGGERDPGAQDRGAQGDRALHEDDAGAARAGGERRAGGATARRAAGQDRLSRGVAGRADDRGAGPAGEPRRARAMRAANTTSTRPTAARSASSCSRPRSSRTRTRCATTRAS